MSEHRFNRSGFKRDLIALKEMVRERIYHDLVLDSFNFGFRFGSLHKTMTDKLSKTSTGRLSPEDRIALHPVRMLCFQYKETMMKACHPPELGPEAGKSAADFHWEADELFDEIVKAVDSMTFLCK